MISNPHSNFENPNIFQNISKNYSTTKQKKIMKIKTGMVQSLNIWGGGTLSVSVSFLLANTSNIVQLLTNGSKVGRLKKRPKVKAMIYKVFFIFFIFLFFLPILTHLVPFGHIRAHLANLYFGENFFLWKHVFGANIFFDENIFFLVKPFFWYKLVFGETQLI